MENYLLNYEYEAICISSDEYILSYNNKYYKIGEPIYNILNAGKYAKSLDELYNIIINKNALSKSELSEVINTKLIPIFKITKDVKKETTNNFWIKWQILNSRISRQISKPFTFLFGKLFYPFLIMFIVINIILYFKTNQIKTSIETVQNFEIIKWIISYFSLFIIILLHEIGHVSAAIKSGIKPRGVGLGFYTVLPVMYTDLTDAWKLNKTNKLKVNLAGIFIQLIIGTILVTCINLSSNLYLKEILNHLYIINYVIIGINLIPFLKFDGYWILSDLTGISNLIQESNEKALNLFTKKGPFDEDSNFSLKNYQNIILFIYTILRIFFILGMITLVFSFVIHSLLKTYYFIIYLPYLEFNIDSIVEIIKRVLIILIIYIVTRKYVKTAKEIILNKIYDRKNK